MQSVILELFLNGWSIDKIDWVEIDEFEFESKAT